MSSALRSDIPRPPGIPSDAKWEPLEHWEDEPHRMSEVEKIHYMTRYRLAAKWFNRHPKLKAYTCAQVWFPLWEANCPV